MGTLGWRHHTLVQALLSRGPLPDKEFLSIFYSVTGKKPGTNHSLFDEYLRQINKELAYVQFELRACRNQYTGEVYYGIVNNVADEQSKLGTTYSVVQIAFYKAVLEAIVQEGAAQGSISNIDALNLSLENQIGQGSQGGSHVPSAFKNFGMSQREKALEELVRDQWLCFPSDGNIGLGIRSFLDLRSWFRSNEVASCQVCNEAGVKADICSNTECVVRIHDYCLQNKFSQRRVERVCPSCGTQWQCSDLPLGEAEDENGQTPVDESSLNSAGPVTRKRLRNCKVEQADEGGAAPSRVSDAQSCVVGRTRSSRRRR